MKRFFSVIVLSLAWCSVASSESYMAKVIGVSDGDTVTVLREKTPVKIRLNGIDCPETGQDFGSKAKELTSGLVFGQSVRVIRRDTDRYGRTVADLFLPDGRMLNQELVRLGHAWWYRKYAPNDGTLAKFEAEAKAANRGLWAQPGAVAPWEWRSSGGGLPPALRVKFIGNRNSKVYHQPGCANAAKMSDTNRVPFDSAAAAERSGYRAGRDCSR
jgi:endonuclease YncB( thermonuclease family)